MREQKQPIQQTNVPDWKDIYQATDKATNADEAARYLAVTLGIDWTQSVLFLFWGNKQRAMVH